MAYLGLLALRVAAQLFGRFVLLDEGPYRLEGKGGRRVDLYAAGLMDGRVRDTTSDVMNTLEFGMKYGSGNH